jgi:DNA polymerase-3 subunit gamma/tau
LEHAHGAALAKTLGPDALTLPKDQGARLTAMGAELSAGTLSRLWQMLLKAQDEARRAGDPKAVTEMAIIRLCYAADLPGPEEALKALQNGEPIRGVQSSAPSGGSSPGGSTAIARQPQPQAQSHPAPAIPAPQSFEDVVRLIDDKRDIALKLDVERYMRPVSFRPGAITFEPAPGAPSNLAQRLVTRLKEWTGQPWLVAAEGGGGGESLYERAQRETLEVRRGIEADPFVKSVLKAFPGAEIIGVRTLQIEAPAAPADVDEASEDD